MTTSEPPRLALVAAVNNDFVLENNLAQSPVISDGRASVCLERGCRSAGIAYNRGIDQTTSDLIVLAHQDVYLPQGWENKVFASIRQIETDLDAKWAVLGVFGITSDAQYVGRVWSSGLRREAVGLSGPRAVASIDELVIILRRDSCLRFDEGLPGFHLYGTDIVQSALAAGFGAFVINAPVVHNSHPVRKLDKRFCSAHRYMRRKWANRLPIPTCVVPLTSTTWPLWRSRLADCRRALLGRRLVCERVSDPGALAVELGYALAESDGNA